jgi:hypothetical protein
MKVGDPTAASAQFYRSGLGCFETSAHAIENLAASA